MEQDNIKPKRSRQRGPLRNFVLGTLVIVAVAGIGLSIWGMRRYDRLVSVGKRIEERYGTLAKRFSFEPPVAGQADPARLDQMLLARDELHMQLPAEAQALGAELMKGDGLEKRRMARVLLQIGPQFEPAAARHAAALEKVEMSPQEYRWLLGGMVAEALRGNEETGVGAEYRRVLAGMNAAAREAEIEAAYTGAGIDAARMKQLATPNPAGYLADLVTLTVKEHRAK